MKSSNNRYIQVLLTYIRRPMFWILTAWMALVPLFIVAMYHLKKNPFNQLSPRNDVEIFVQFSCLLLPTAWGATLIFHAKEQLQSWRNVLTPGYRIPHMVIAAILFAGIMAILGIENVFGINWVSFFVIAGNSFNTSWEYYFYSLLAVLIIMSASGWCASFKSQRVTIAVVLVLLISAMGLPILFSFLSIYFTSPLFNYRFRDFFEDLAFLLPRLFLIGIVVGLGCKLALMGRRRGRLVKIVESIKQVFLAYVCRPGFRNLWFWQTVFILCFIILISVLVHCQYFQGPAAERFFFRHRALATFISDLINAISFGFMVFLPAAWGAFWGNHFREVSQRLRYELMPHYRLAQLTGASLAFVFTALLLAIFYIYFASYSFMGPLCIFTLFGSGPYYSDHGPYYESGKVMILIFTVMTMSAWWAYFHSQWLATLFGMLTVSTPIIIEYYYVYLNFYIISNTYYYLVGPVMGALSIACLALLVLLGVLFAFDPKRYKAVLKEPKDAPARQSTRNKRLRIDAFWSRALYRRVYILKHKTLWLIASIAAIVLTYLMIPGRLFSSTESAVKEWDYYIINMFCSIITVTPAIATAFTWYFRRPAVVREYFYPVQRNTFIHEMSVALVCDLTEFWFMIAAVALLPLAICTPWILTNPVFWLGLAASVLAQVLVFGAIALCMSLHNWALGMLGLCAALGWLVSPILVDIQKVTSIGVGVEQTFIFSLIAVPIGLILTAAAYYRWQRIELAAR